MNRAPSRLKVKGAALAVACAVLSLWATPSRADPLSMRPRQDFVAPAAGSYTLPVIQQGPQGKVLNSDGRARDIALYTRGAITLLSFMYTYCTDPIACPLAYSTMLGLRERLLASPDLARRVRFVSLSFDPVNDTPEAMGRYAGKLAHADQRLRWYFLTGQSVRELAPIVDGLGQSVRVRRDAGGHPTRLYDHMLKLFLFDAQGRVREIYSSAFLQADVMYNDMHTLAIEQDRAVRPQP
ncbi:MAG TPA: SCO family protein [Janthinobacterium sp.]|nr:SCO family protein [Janthinobacterium sp.]